MSDAQEEKFPLDLRQTAQTKMTEAEIEIEIAEHRFHQFATPRLDGLTFRRS